MKNSLKIAKIIEPRSMVASGLCGIELIVLSFMRLSAVQIEGNLFSISCAKLMKIH